MSERSHPLQRQSRRRYAGRPSGGFTLIEIVLAFSILAIGMTLAMQAATHSVRQARQAAEQTEAALLAQNLLDAIGRDERLEEGESEGEFDDSPYRWRLTVNKYEPVEDAGLPAAPVAMPTEVELLEIELVIEWDAGDRRRESRFNTLRALLPDTLQ